MLCELLELHMLPESFLVALFSGGTRGKREFCFYCAGGFVRVKVIYGSNSRTKMFPSFSREFYALILSVYLSTALVTSIQFIPGDIFPKMVILFLASWFIFFLIHYAAAHSRWCMVYLTFGKLFVKVLYFTASKRCWSLNSMLLHPQRFQLEISFSFCCYRSFCVKIQKKSRLKTENRKTTTKSAESQTNISTSL